MSYRVETGEPTPTPLSGDGALRSADFPLPTAEVYGLTGLQADLYNAGSLLGSSTGPNALRAIGPGDCDLMLPRFTLLGSYAEDGDAFFLTGGSGCAISLTLDEQGNCVGYLREPYETPVDEFYDWLCSPRTDIADYLKGKTEEPPEGTVTFPLPKAEDAFLHADELLLPYFRAHFPNTDEWAAAQSPAFQEALHSI